MPSFFRIGNGIAGVGGRYYNVTRSQLEACCPCGPVDSGPGVIVDNLQGAWRVTGVSFSTMCRRIGEVSWPANGALGVSVIERDGGNGSKILPLVEGDLDEEGLSCGGCSFTPELEWSGTASGTPEDIIRALVGGNIGLECVFTGYNSWYDCNECFCCYAAGSYGTILSPLFYLDPDDPNAGTLAGYEPREGAGVYNDTADDPWGETTSQVKSFSVSTFLSSRLTGNGQIGSLAVVDFGLSEISDSGQAWMWSTSSDKNYPGSGSYFDYMTPYDLVISFTIQRVS